MCTGGSDLSPILRGGSSYLSHFNNISQEAARTLGGEGASRNGINFHHGAVEFSGRRPQAFREEGEIKRERGEENKTVSEFVWCPLLLFALEPPAFSKE